MDYNYLLISHFDPPRIGEWVVAWKGTNSNSIDLGVLDGLL